MSDGRNYLFGEYAITKSGWSPIAYEAFVVCNINIEAEYNLHCGIMRFAHVQKNAWFCSSFLLNTLTTSAHENIINPRGETLKLETRDSSKHSLGPTKRNKQQWPLSCGQNLFCNFPPWAWSGRSPKPYKLGIGRYRLGYRWVLPLNLQNMQSTAAPRKQHQNLVWNWCPVFIIWTWNMGYAGFMSCFKVQGNFLLLCSSSKFVGYSYLAYNDINSKTTSLTKS